MRSILLLRKGFTQSFIVVTLSFGVCCCAEASGANRPAQPLLPSAPYPVGMTQVEFVESANGGRPLDFMLCYPAAPSKGAIPFKMFMAANLDLYKDAPIVADRLKHPLIMFSHGAGGNGSVYAWFGEYLASHGYLVALAMVREEDFAKQLRLARYLAA